MALTVIQDRRGERLEPGIGTMRSGRMSAGHLVVILIALLCGCHTPYELYRERSWVHQLKPDAFQVSYNFGGSFTSYGYPYSRFMPEKGRNLALLRAAEITLSHGFKYLVVTEERTYTRAPAIKEGFIKPTVVLKIRCYTNKPADPEALDAAFLQRSLKKKYRLE